MEAKQKQNSHVSNYNLFLRQVQGRRCAGDAWRERSVDARPRQRQHQYFRCLQLPRQQRLQRRVLLWWQGHCQRWIITHTRSQSGCTHRLMPVTLWPRDTSHTNLIWWCNWLTDHNFYVIYISPCNTVAFPRTHNLIDLYVKGLKNGFGYFYNSES